MGYDDQIKSLRTEVQTLHNQAKGLYADLEAKGDKATADERISLNSIIDSGTSKREALKRLESLQATEDQLAAVPERKQRTHTPERTKSWGQMVRESDEFKQASKSPNSERMDRVNVKAIYGSTDGSGGALIQSQRLPDVVDLPFRPASVLDMINQSTTNGDAVEYAVLASRTNSAAPVAEFTGGNFGLKPESDMTWTLATTNVKTIATWVATSRRILADAPRLQNQIDIDLTNMLRVVLENQVISGSGVGENFTGLLSAAGIQLRTQAAGARALAGDTVADTLRRAITDVVLEFFTPNGIVLNPGDFEAVELQKGTDNHYVLIMDATTGRLWRLPVAQTAALTAKTALVADFEMAATLWDRQQTEIRVGEPNDFFLRNALAILAELRAAFAVTRPKAIVKVTLT